jgi:hypothetical protein
MITPQSGVQVDATMAESDLNYWSAGVKYHFQ